MISFLNQKCSEHTLLLLKSVLRSSHSQGLQKILELLGFVGNCFKTLRKKDDVYILLRPS